MIGLFHTLGFVCLCSTILLIKCKNPVYSLLCLVLLFVCGSLLLLLVGADFIAFVFIVVYVGALAVLFLFVVIMLNIKVYNQFFSFKDLFSVLILSLVFCCFLMQVNQDHTGFISLESTLCLDFDRLSNLNALGQVLYTRYFLHFVICGLVLLVAMIGAIILTSRSKTKSIKQKVFKQGVRSSIIGKFSLSKQT